MSLKLSLLQAEKPHLSQPVLIKEVLQPFDHLCGLPLQALQKVHVLPLLGPPDLNAIFQVGFKRIVNGENHLTRPPSHTSFEQTIWYCWLFYICPSIIYERICSIVLTGTEMRLTGL